MSIADAAGEWLRLSEHYRRMTDGELLALARQVSSLTSEAQQVLRHEMEVRRLKPPAEEPPAPVVPEPDPDSPYAEDRELVEICKVWSLSDGLQVQHLFDVAGVPFVMGMERATRVESVTSNFGEGVPVGVMRIGVPWAWQALQNYEPADEPKETQPERMEIFVACPRCGSVEIVFEGLSPRPRTRNDMESAEFEWSCDVCGYQWADDGVVKEK